MRLEQPKGELFGQCCVVVGFPMGLSNDRQMRLRTTTLPGFVRCCLVTACFLHPKSCALNLLWIYAEVISQAPSHPLKSYLTPLVFSQCDYKHFMTCFARLALYLFSMRLQNLRVTLHSYHPHVAHALMCSLNLHHRSCKSMQLVKQPRYMRVP